MSGPTTSTAADQIVCAHCERGIRQFGAASHPDPAADGVPLCGPCYNAALWAYQQEQHAKQVHARNLKEELAEAEADLADAERRIAEISKEMEG